MQSDCSPKSIKIRMLRAGKKKKEIREGENMIKNP